MKTDSASLRDTPIPITPIRFVWFVLWHRKVAFLLALLGVGIASILHQVTPLIFKWVVDAVEAQDLSAIPYLLAWYPFLFFAIQLTYRGSAVAAGYVGIGGKEFINRQLNTHVLDHSYSYFTERFAGALANKITTVAKSFETFIEYVIWNYLDALVTFGITFFFIMTVSSWTAVTFACLCLTLIALNILFAKTNERYAAESVAAQSKYRGVLVDVVGNISLIRQFSRATFELQFLQTVLARTVSAEYRTRFYGEFIIVSNSIIITLFYSGMLWIVATEYIAGTMSTGEVILVLGLLVQIAYQLLFLGNAFVNGAKSFGELKEGLTELLLPHDIVDLPGASTLIVPAGQIVWQDVTFEYDQTTVFTQFNLTIKAGERVGLVGASGAGKSTLVSLLLRQYDIESGAILIDGQNIAEVTQDSLRANIAVVPQEPALFHRTIRENIAYGRVGASDEEIIAVAKKAFAHDFIMELPQGYDTLVGERGVKLSGGQKQRIAIARAMLKDAPILLLDEATSALDSESEVVIQRALHQLMRGKTVIAIAHRLSTLREMDRIIVLEAGNIVEDGTHDSLREYGGTYARLWDHQAGGFLVEAAS